MGVQAGGGVEEGWGAGASVQEFVAAAYGEVRVGGGEIDRDGAGGMGEVPEDQGAFDVRRGGDRCHVVHGAGVVVDVGEKDDGGVFVDGGGDFSWFDEAQFVAATEERVQALGDVEVGGKGAAF